ncbi:MAG: Ni/Fe-hydrogenase cytochrome b subunit [Candidatus Acidiferrum sp.]
MNMKIPKLSFWKSILVIILIPGLYSLVYRLTHGLGQSTNLTDDFPWGLWVGFKLFSVALAGGGFTLAAVVYIFNLKRYRPVLRAMILTAFLGYSMFIASLILDLGRPYRIWHPLVMWNHHSVMFEIAWCVMLYTTVLFLEFLPVVLERFGMKRQLEWLHTIMIPLVIAGVILSTLHQSSLGSLYLIVPGKLYPLWYSPLEPVFFFVSAICAGLAMTIFESWHADKAFHQRLEFSLLTGLGRVLAVALSFYLSLRLVDLMRRHELHLLTQPRSETYLFFLEIALLTVPMLLLFRRSIHTNRTALYICSVLTLLGFVANRMNVAITGMLASSGDKYFPKWTEISITLAIIASGFLVFALAVKYLPIFPNGHTYEPASSLPQVTPPASVPELSHVRT